MMSWPQDLNNHVLSFLDDTRALKEELAEAKQKLREMHHSFDLQEWHWKQACGKLEQQNKKLLIQVRGQKKKASIRRL